MMETLMKMKKMVMRKRRRRKRMRRRFVQTVVKRNRKCRGGVRLKRTLLNQKPVRRTHL